MDWTTPHRSSDLARDEAHVWRIDLRARSPIEGDLAILSDEERRRARRFRFEIHRDRYVAAHAALRRVLARYLDASPGDIRFRSGPRGKPYLAGADRRGDVRFNLSDSGDLALCAVTRGREIGVDVERLRRDAPVLDLARRWLAPSEVAALRALPPPRRTAAFFACWTRKEAYVKAHGGSIIRSLRTFAVSVAPEDRAVEVVVHDDPDAARRWTVVSLDVAPGFAGAVAAEGEVRLRGFRWV